MKAILITFTTLSLLISNAIFAQAPSEAVAGTTITVKIPVASDQGQVVFGLYTQNNFLQQPIDGINTQVEDGVATVTFNNVTPGEYAVIAFHDKNNDNQMNFDVNGMPLEDYGASNNIMSYGPPQWGNAKFEVADAPVALEIRF